MTTGIAILAACCAAVLLLVAYRLRRRRRFRRLQWPGTLGYYGFRRHVMFYLQHCGWRITQDSVPPVSFFADKGKRRFAVVCVHAGMDVRTTRIKDMGSLSDRVRRNRPVVLVCMEKPEDQYVEYAAGMRVTVLWYKDLDRL